LGKEVSFVGKPTPLYPHLTQRLFKKNPIWSSSLQLHFCETF
jgi:hypothetical protein